MTKLEEARKQRMETMDFFWENENLKEQILDVIIEVLNHRTKVGEFDPIKIVFADRPKSMKDNILIHNHWILYSTYLNEDKQKYIEKGLPNLQWYARVIHAYLSEQEELVVSELCQSEEENSASFTVNFSIK